MLYDLQTLAIFLISNVTNNQTTSEVVVETKKEFSLTLFQLLEKGGWVMIPIVLLFLATVFLFLERYFFIKSAGKTDDRLINNVIQTLARGKTQDVVTICQNHNSLLANVFEKGALRLGSSISEIEAGMEAAAKNALSTLEKNLSLLAAISTLAPLFGFLGTVMGMIRAFSDIAIADNLSIGIIAGGIYEKMITSAAGLIVGIIAHVCFVTLHTMVDRKLQSFETASNQFIDTLYKPQQV